MSRVRMVKDHPLLILEHDGESVERGKGDRAIKRESRRTLERYLIAADLHIGFEHELATKGIRMDSSYVKEMLDELLSIARDEHCNGMILLGDIKDSTRGMSREEWRSIPLFITELARHLELYIVPGNHDSYLRRFMPDSVRLMSSKGMLIGDTLLMHGHTSPSVGITTVRRMVMGHLHPTLASSDSILSGERVWMILKVEASDHMLDIVVMPSLNRYMTMLHRRSRYGNSNNSNNSNNGIIQLLRRLIGSNLTIMKAVILTLDGSVVGDENTLIQAYSL
ncbi:MAG: metallophosphoesterase [Candidatus Nitrosocaldus sp.]